MLTWGNLILKEGSKPNEYQLTNILRGEKEVRREGGQILHNIGVRVLYLGGPKPQAFLTNTISAIHGGTEFTSNQSLDFLIVQNIHFIYVIMPEK